MIYITSNLASIQGGCSDGSGGYLGLKEASMLTFLKCYHYHITENIQMINKTEVVAIIRHVGMLSSLVQMEENEVYAYTDM